MNKTTVRDALVLLALCFFNIWLILQVFGLGHL